MLCIAVVLVLVMSFVFANFSLATTSNNQSGRPYKIEISRLEQNIKNNKEYNPADYEYITNVEVLSDCNKQGFYSVDSDYAIKDINGNIYRFDYDYKPTNDNMYFTVNMVLIVVSLAVAGILLFLYINIIRPFVKLRNVPIELAKGNLTIPLKESKFTYFGKFVWGMDLLREKLEQQKSSELALQKDKKTLVLSLSHDIKTPLGIIELYAKALKKGLYTDEKKKSEVAQNISDKCGEIKGYVDDIIKASNEDFLNLEVNNSEFYLSELVNAINSFYIEKLNLLKIEFVVGKYNDLIIKGDLDRSIEVVQNVIENAVKYGDGKKIEIAFYKEEGCLLFAVSNTGSDISNNEITHIFDSFWRGSNVGSNSGSGLGLYICRQLMYKMGGDIFAENKDGKMTVSLVFTMM